jgi:crotonobetainyl-CoA:carnitine CoA-transferase CaiB-like acyl-CoA transferase
MSADGHGPLAGLEVVERAGRLSVSACGFLLASLGARVLRVETPEDESAVATASEALQRLLIAGKTRVRARDFRWSDALSKARVVLLSSSASDPVLGMLRAAIDRSNDPSDTAEGTLDAGRSSVVCCLSAQGLGYPDFPENANDALLQALGGLMAVTGLPDGEPEYARVPVGELSAAAIATTAIVASLRARQSRLIDLSIVEIVADQLRSHVSLLQSGRTGGFRSGCAHPLCCPWNAYRASDGWLLVCSATDAHWAGIAKAIGSPELAHDARYATRAARLGNREAVDACIADFTRTRPVDELLQLIGAAEVPVGPVVPTTAVAEDPVLRASGSVEGRGAGAVARAPLRIRAIEPGPEAGTRRVAAMPPGARTTSPPHALAGVRVVELTVYAAGPLAGFALASLGAEVTKIESPSGEECRTWQPQFDGVSGYFANYNAGKRSMRLDLRGEDGRDQLRALLETADVFLHNLRPGAVERLGFGVDAVAKINPRIVYCAISGYGSDGPPLPALDTVIQGHGGLASAVGDGSVPLRIGYSIADQLAGHFAAAGIVSALHAVATTGQAQHVDMAMVDAIAWLTHLAWAGPDTLPPACRIRTRDGFVMAAAANLPVESRLSRVELVEALAATGIAAAPVLDADEVLQQPALVARSSLKQVEAPMGHCVIDVFAAPFGMPVVVPGRMARLGEHDMTK